jgi:hypothetical protein
MDCDHSKLKATVFGIHDWLNYLRDQAAKCRKLVEQADDPLVKTELLALASVCVTKHKLEPAPVSALCQHDL